MAIQRFLAIVAGKMQEVLGLDVSAGASSAGQIIASNSAGKLDSTFLPAGIGQATRALPATEALSAGALVNVWSSGGTTSARNSDGSVTGKPAHGFVLAAVALGGTATVYGPGAENTSATGLTPGPLFLSATTPGGTSSTAAAAAGQTYQEVGNADSATSFLFSPGPAIGRA